MTLSHEDRELLSLCHLHTGVFAKTFMPEFFSRGFDPGHKRIFNLLDKGPLDPGYKPQKAVAGFRGLGKTSLLGRAAPAKKILFQEVHYIIYIAASLPTAIEKSEALKNWLVESPLVKHYFGDVRGETHKAGQWGKEYFEVIVGGDHRVTIVPKGAEQKIRGALNKYGYRPDYILVDDVEDPDEMDSDEVRAKKKKRFHANVKNLVDRGAELGAWEITVVGNVLHQDSLIVELCKSSYWDSLTEPLCTTELETLYPNFMSSSQCSDLFDEFQEAGQIDVFYREYLCDPTMQGEHAPFQQKFFQYYKPEEALKTVGNWTVVVIDASRTAKASAAPTGIVCWRIDPTKNLVDVRDVRQGKWHPEEQYEQLAEVITSNDADLLAVEVTGLHEFITHPLRTFLHARGIFIEILELHARGGANEKGKVARVRQLVPWYRQGLIRHNKIVCKDLERQLLTFPFASNWSLMDPFGYINEILEHGQIYLSPGYDEYEDTPESLAAEDAALAAIEDTFEDLEDFRYLETNWYDLSL